MKPSTYNKVITKDYPSNLDLKEEAQQKKLNTEIEMAAYTQWRDHPITKKFIQEIQTAQGMLAVRRNEIADQFESHKQELISNTIQAKTLGSVLKTTITGEYKYA